LIIKTHKNNYAMSRHRRYGIIALCLLVVLLFVWLDHKPLSHIWNAQSESKTWTQAQDFGKYHSKSFNVLKVVDGDTIDIDVPDKQNKHTRIRLLGIDTPETNNSEVGDMYFGPEAAEFTRKLVLGKPVTVYLDEGNPTRGKYGRLLAYVKLPDAGFLNEILLAEGFAYADLRFSHSFYNKYKQLEAGARGLKKGLWQKVNHEQLPEWRQKETPNLLRR
jgi:endonuclease YncB( thermonuclease family)